MKILKIWLLKLLRALAILLTALIATLHLVLSGCTPAGDAVGGGGERGSPQRMEEGAFTVLVMFDMSRSYDILMTEKGKAWLVMTKILDTYFKDTIGNPNNFIIVGQLSKMGTKDVIWEGTPLQLRQKFTPESFRQLLKDHSDPNGSCLHDGIRRGVEYLMTRPGVAERRCRTYVAIASDLDDNQSEYGEKGVNYLLGTLDKYRQTGGAISLLFVQHTRVVDWERNLKATGFTPGHYAVVSEIVENPPILLNFSDD